MMQLPNVSPSHRRRYRDDALPAQLSSAIHQLAWRLASCDPAATGPREVTVVIRRKPHHAQGRAGCHVEIYADGHSSQPQVRADLLRQLRQHRAGAGASYALNLSTPLLGGWKITLDASWTPQKG